MKRCSRCLMIDSLPESNFDDTGSCSWCRNSYPNYKPHGTKALEKKIEQSYSPKSPADFLIGISGGKDSSYALLEIKKTFGKRVEAFTYSHFGLNDFALKNAKRISSALGVKHHIISLPNKRHFKSFQRYFISWFKYPSIVSAGLTCVACKHMHILACNLARERQIPNVLWANCPLEYAPFIAVKRINNNKHFQRTGLLKNTVVLMEKIIHEPMLIQNILTDARTTVPGCLALSPTSKYLNFKFPDISHLFFYDYCEWRPDIIIEKIEQELDWERPQDYPDDWHSDCLFEVFKQYMFQKMLGVSYTDAFLSNQIRHGILTREYAWEKLIATKEFYSKEIPLALKKVGLPEFEIKIDYSCFEI